MGGSRRSGAESDEAVDVVIDAAGTTAIPGLIDSHGHPALGDFTPRQRGTLDVYDSMLHGGVTRGLGWRGPCARGGRRTHGPRGARDYRGQAYAGVPARRREGPRRGADRRGGPHRGRHRGDGCGRREAARGDRARVGADWRRGSADGRVGAEARDGLDRSTRAGLRCRIVGERGTGHRGPDRHRRSHQRRHDLDVGRRHRAARRDVGMAIKIVHNGNGRTALVALGAAGPGWRPRPGRAREFTRRAGPE